MKSWVTGTLSEDILGHAVSLTIAALFWKALTKHYTQNSIACKFDLVAQLQHIEKGNKPLVVYLREFKTICDQLNAIGKPMFNVTQRTLRQL